MASNNFYHAGNQFSDPPGYSSASHPHPYGNYPPSGQPPLEPQSFAARGSSRQPQQPDPIESSPFDSVFDDRYVTQSSNNLAQSNPHGDTSYHGHNGHDTRPAADGIPLQDRAGKNDDVTDHIYDAPENGASGRGRSSRRKGVRVGELGMFRSGGSRIPWVCYIFAVVQAGVFIGEIIKHGMLTGSPIMIKPQFNPMIGPSQSVLINMGARYAPCMHNVKEIQGSASPVYFPCPNATQETQVCPLSELCGFGGVPNPTFNNAQQSPQPNQWFRFILPIFLHAGLIHIGFNMLLQLTLAKEMEQAIGSIRFFLVYLSSGIFGFVMGGNFSPPGISSTGASGSLFGVIALTLLDLLYSWNERRSPVKDLMFILIDMIISFVLGLLPGLDNFSHIGGFLMGLALGVCILHSPNALRRIIGDHENASYSAVTAGNGTAPGFFKNPIGFFKGRKPLWWAWWLVRVGFLITVIVVFIVLINNFYTGAHTCGWCKYLSCLPVNGWCDLGSIQSQSPTTTTIPA